MVSEEKGLKNPALKMVYYIIPYKIVREMVETLQ